jgi:hypothetical protein
MTAASYQYVHDNIGLRFKAWREPEHVVARSKDGDSAAVFQNSCKFLRCLKQKFGDYLPRVPSAIDGIIACCD